MFKPESTLVNLAKRRYRIAEVDLVVEAPMGLLRILDLSMSRVPFSKESIDLLSIVVTISANGWTLSGTTPTNTRLVPSDAPMPDLAGAVLSAIIDEVSVRTRLTPLRAIVVERDGMALGLGGSNWEVAMTIAAHLNTRGWRLMTGCYSFIDCDTLEVDACPRLLFVTTHSLEGMPTAYRAILERSPWYSRNASIAFYAVDPAVVLGTGAWSDRGKLRALVETDIGTATEVVPIDLSDIGSWVGAPRESLSQVNFGRISSKHPITAANAIERWFKHLA